MAFFYIAKSLKALDAFKERTGIQIARYFHPDDFPDTHTAEWARNIQEFAIADNGNYYTTDMIFLNCVPADKVYVIADEQRCESLDEIDKRMGFLDILSAGEVFLNYHIEQLFAQPEPGIKKIEVKDELYARLTNDVKDYVSGIIDEYHSAMPEQFYRDIINDVMECSAYNEGYFSNDDIHLAFQRVIAEKFGVEI